MEQSREHGTVTDEGAIEKIGAHDRLIDLKVVVTLLGVCSRTVHRLVAAGELAPPVKVGRASRWFMSDIDGYMKRLRQGRVGKEVCRDL